MVRGSTLVNGRTKLLDAANGLFARAPFSSVGVAQILEGAGVQAPTLYHHFGDKEGLYVAWAESAMAEAGARIAGALAMPGDLRSKFAGVATALLAGSNHDVLLTLREATSLSRAESGERILNAYFTFVYEPVCSLIVQAIASGMCRPDPVGRIADVFLMGTYALSPGYGRSAAPTPEACEWWGERFLAAVRP